MSTLVRKQIYLDRRLDQLLKQHAEQTGQTQSAIIRQAIEDLLQSEPTEAIAAWEELKAFYLERQRLATEVRKRDWTREDLYDRTLEQKS